MFLRFRVVVRFLRFTRAGSHWCAKLEFQGGSSNIRQNFGGIRYSIEIWFALFNDGCEDGNRKEDDGDEVYEVD